jgi:hypothetical protein
MSKEGRSITLRVARPTERLEEITAMYRDGLGLELLGSFEGHNGFDGRMLGVPGCPYHLEFTCHRGHDAGSAPSEDNLLIFYLPDRDEWESACARMLRARFREVAAYNSYWDRDGKSFEDLDGYRVVLQHGDWPAN